MAPDIDHSGAVVGFFVAIGGSSSSHAPYLEGPIDVALVETSRKYKRSCARARKAWSRFSTFCATQGVVMPDARLYIVQTETG